MLTSKNDFGSTPLFMSLNSIIVRCHLKFIQNFAVKPSRLLLVGSFDFLLLHQSHCLILDCLGFLCLLASALLVYMCAGIYSFLLNSLLLECRFSEYLHNLGFSRTLGDFAFFISNHVDVGLFFPFPGNIG